MSTTLPAETTFSPIRRRRPRAKKPTQIDQPQKRARVEGPQTPIGHMTASEQSLNTNNSTSNASSTLIHGTSPVSATSPPTGVTSSASSVATTPVPAPSVTYNFVNNELVLSKTRVWTTVHDPGTQRLLARVPDSTLSEIQNIVTQAAIAQESWQLVSFSKRRAMMLRLLEAVRVNAEIFATCISTEAGKTLDDASSEVVRALDMIETACSIQSSDCGSHLTIESTSTHTNYEPLGVCMTVSPFNFPLLIGLWSIPFAIMTGNTVVWKPSERCPSAAVLLAKCFYQAEFPPGVMNVVHGGSSAVEKLLSQPQIKAVSFVGSDAAGERVHAHAIATRKRIQAELSSKNHGIILDDALKERTLYSIAGSAFGAAGQRCMALSVVIFVGSTSSWLPDLVRIASSLKVGIGSEPGVALGPLITTAAKERVEGIIQTAVDEGATLLLDGRNVVVPDYPKGNFVGPTILSNVQPYMDCYQTEIFGPVLCCMQAETFDEAVQIVNDNRYGNGCTLFTQSPHVAQKFERKVNVGQIGINVPVLASPGQLLRTGNKDSYLGHKNLPGQSGWHFFTMMKTVTTLWRDL